MNLKKKYNRVRPYNKKGPESNEFHSLGLIYKTDQVTHHKYSKIYDFFLQSIY